MKYNFIQTCDMNVRDDLIRAGFKLVSESGGLFVFLNDRPLTFEDKKNNIHYSNMLCV